LHGFFWQINPELAEACKSIYYDSVNEFGKFMVIAGLLPCSSRRATLVRFRQRLAWAFARRHQLFKGKLQFSFSHRDLPVFNYDSDTADVAVQKVTRHKL
jgi:hypothetical protein